MNSKRIAVLALMTALVAVATIAIRIPMPATDGYVNLGDAFVLFCGVVFGPVSGSIAGGVGSALADLIGGYAHWILPTFLIKGMEGALVGMLFSLFKRIGVRRFFAAGFSSILSAIWMVVGYFFASWVMKGSAAVAFTSVTGNAAQGGVGVVLCVALLLATYRIRGISSLVGSNRFYDLPKPKDKA